MPSPTLPSVDSDPYDLPCRVSSHRFWPRVSEQGVHQLTADSFTFGNFPASTFWSTALRKRLKWTNSLFFPCVPWRTWVSNLTDLGWSCPVSPISPRVLELCWEHPGQGRCTNNWQQTSIWLCEVPLQMLQQSQESYILSLQWKKWPNLIRILRAPSKDTLLPSPFV